jgi:hypothetical protein
MSFKWTSEPGEGKGTRIIFNAKSKAKPPTVKVKGPTIRRLLNLKHSEKHEEPV